MHLLWVPATGTVTGNNRVSAVSIYLGNWRKAKQRLPKLHYDAFCRIHEVAAFLVVENSQDLNARDFDEE